MFKLYAKRDVRRVIMVEIRNRLYREGNDSVARFGVKGNLSFFLEKVHAKRGRRAFWPGNSLIKQISIRFFDEISRKKTKKQKRMVKLFQIFLENFHFLDICT